MRLPIMPAASDPMAGDGGDGRNHRRAAGAGSGGIAEGGVCAVSLQDDLYPPDDAGDSAGTNIQAAKDNAQGAQS